MRKTTAIPKKEEVAQKTALEKDKHVKSTDEFQQKEQAFSSTGINDDKELTEELIKPHWDAYLEANKEKLPVLKLNALKNKYSVQGNEISLTLSNPLEADAVEEIQVNFVSYLKQKLGVSTLFLKKQVNTQIAQERPYTPSEKLQHMIEKNPALKELTDKLGLDTDF